MSDITAFFVLSMSLYTGVYNTKSLDASRAASYALYRQTKTQERIEELVDKRTSPELRSKVGNIFLIVNSVAEKRIVYEWHF
jgi:hypothetical protein